MSLGVCYYPEQWPEDRWAADVAAMARLGLRYVRVGEFAWGRLEPQLGHFDWSMLDRVLDLLTRHGLLAVLGTPSATPPHWLVELYPDILPVGKDGRVRQFGSRRHYCFSHKPYRKMAADMAERMAVRYGRHPTVAGWQIDNEYGCHDTVRCACALCRRGFQQWLFERYRTVEALNQAWGTAFW
ncbi:MAG TPA: beta-galactosidase, partial [Candidatus Xenobia bacterium]